MVHMDTDGDEHEMCRRRILHFRIPFTLCLFFLSLSLTHFQCAFTPCHSFDWLPFCLKWFCLFLSFGCALASVWRRRMCLWCGGVKGNRAAACQTLAMATHPNWKFQKIIRPFNNDNNRPAIFFGHIQVICHTDMISSFLSSQMTTLNLAAQKGDEFVVLKIRCHSIGCFSLMISCHAWNFILFDFPGCKTKTNLDLGKKKRMKLKRLSEATRPKYIHVHVILLTRTKSIWKIEQKA